MLRCLEDCVPGDPLLGGKADGLARLQTAGLRVPPTVVLTADEFRTALAAAGSPPALVAAPLAPPLAAALATLPFAGPYAVRSSATCEDRQTALAPGIFHSVLDVPAAALADAVRAVWASLHGETARAYLAARGVPPDEVAMAVVIQPYLTGLGGTAYSRAPGNEDCVLIERTGGGLPAIVARADAAVIAAGDLPAPLAAAIARAALAAEAALGAPADVEWIAAGATLWLVQARPIASGGRAAPAFGADDLAFSAAQPDVVWTWDAAHNPAPLSPAQEGLVQLVDDARGAPQLRQRVVDGYLYYADAAAPAAVIPAADLRRAYDEQLRPAMEAALARLAQRPTLDEALSAYVDFYRVYAGVLAPALRAARASTAPRGAIPSAPPTRAPLVWDVAAPAVALPPLPPLPPRPAQAVTESESSLAAWVAALAEEDDELFARAQDGVRQALARVAAAWGVSVDDVCWLPLTRLSGPQAAAPPSDLAVRVAAARAEHARRRALVPPDRIVAGRAIHAALPHAPGDRLLTGRGVGGRVRGRVTRLDAALDAATVPTSLTSRVLVVATVLPQMAALLARAAGVIAEHGGLLGHGAALARELGLPCLVGCRGALTLVDGESVLLDADAGVVIRLQAGELTGD